MPEDVLDDILPKSERDRHWGLAVCAYCEITGQNRALAIMQKRRVVARRLRKEQLEFYDAAVLTIAARVLDLELPNSRELENYKLGKEYIARAKREYAVRMAKAKS